MARRHALAQRLGMQPRFPGDSKRSRFHLNLVKLHMGLR
jgi:hypothetical protein